MATLDLSPDFLDALQHLVQQARHALPTVPQPVDFSAQAWIWENK